MADGLSEPAFLLGASAALACACYGLRRASWVGLGGAGLFVLGRDHPDIIAERAGDLFGDGEARRMNAVVIGDQDAHIQPILVLPFM